jgi:eukaryotic-like serine/threonine-protein kinase
MSVRTRLWDYQPNWLRLGDWLVKPAENIIIKDAERVTLEPKVMDLLLFLALHRDCVQSNEVLLKEVWGGSFYSDNPLHRSIAVLRRALGDSAAKPRYIQTLRKRGYQCIASLGFPDQAPNPSTAEQLKFASACPFPGLDAFTADDSAVFFGRTQALATLGDALSAQWQLGRGLILVLGPSGCGKSSFVQAGILPLLRSGATPLPTRIGASAHLDFSENLSLDPLTALIQALATWRIADRQVFLASELHPLLHPLAPMSGESAHADTVDALGSAELTRAFTQNLRRAGLLIEGAACSCAAVLVVDHLELLVQAPVYQHANLTRMDQIFSALAATGAVIVLLVARSDFYQALLRGLPQTMALKAGAGHFDLPPPTAAEIAQMIRGPARLAGLSFERQQSGARLDDVLRDSALAQPESLPLLQFTLEALYKRRSASGLLSFAAYEEIGRLEGALVRRAEDALLTLPKSVGCLPGLFQRMVMLDATQHSASARWVSWADLASDEERDLVHLLVQRRLLVSHQMIVTNASSSHNAGKPGAASGAVQASFRPAHDALLRLWPRAVRWCVENQRLLDVHARVRLASAHWQANGRQHDELLNFGRPVQEAIELMQWAPQVMAPVEVQFVRASIRATRVQEWIRRAAVFGLIGLAIVALTAGVYAQYARGIAEQRRLEAEGMVDFLLNDLADKLRPIGRLDLLNAVGQQALAQYEKSPLITQQIANTIRRAKAMRVIAESMIGQGTLVPAANALTRAQALIETQATASPNSELTLELATIQYWRGFLAYKNADLGSAEIYWKSYLASTQTLLRMAPENTVWQLELTYALNNLGTLASDQRQFARATDYFSRSRQIKTRLHAAKPTDASLTADLADTNIWLATVLESSGQLVSAAAQLQAQVELLQGLVAAHPGDSEWLNRLAAAHAHHSRVALNLGDSKAAEHGNLQAIDLLKTLTASDPSNELWHYSLAYTYLQQAKLLITQNLDAHPMFLLAQNEVDRFAGRNNPISRWQQLDASLLMNRSDRRGDKPSLQGLLRAEKIFSDFLNSPAPSKDNRYASALAQFKLGEYWFEHEHTTNARLYWQSVLTTLRADISTSEQLSNDANQSIAPESLELIARAYVALGQPEHAQQSISRLITMKFRQPEFIRWQLQEFSNTAP